MAAKDGHGTGADAAPRFRSVTCGHASFLIDSRYTSLKPIGDGSYGLVASAVDRKTGRKVAIKKIKDCFVDLIDAKRILREMKLLRHLRQHENLINITDLMTVPTGDPRFEDIYIVTNWMESDLDRIIRSRQPLTDQHYQYFVYQILRGLKYIHSANVLHRDLKPSNLLVNANCDLAICDFGLARGFEVSLTMTEYVVTRWYRAPELLCEFPHYGPSVDVWSVGCIFAEMIIGEAFFQGGNPQEQLEEIARKVGCPGRDRIEFLREPARGLVAAYGDRQPPPLETYFPPETSAAAIDLLRKMLQFHPDDRITVNDALAHEYLADFHNTMPEPVCDSLFDFEFERGDKPLDTDLTKEDVQDLMFREALHFRPEMRPPDEEISEQLAKALSLDDASSRGASPEDEEEVMITARSRDSDDAQRAEAKSSWPGESDPAMK